MMHVSKIKNARFEVSTAVSLKIQVFWDVTFSHWMNISWCVKGLWGVHLQGQAVFDPEDANIMTHQDIRKFHLCMRAVHIHCPAGMKIGITDTPILLVLICEFCRNLPREGHTFLLDINDIVWHCESKCVWGKSQWCFMEWTNLVDCNVPLLCRRVCHHKFK
jgi:hypothetical protein